MSSQTTKQGVQTNWVLEQDKFLSLSELRQLRKTAERWKDEALRKGARTAVKDWFLICVAAETGLRVQEIADLSCGDIQTTDDCRIVIVRNGKGGKPRPVIVRKQFTEQTEEFLSWKKSQGESIEEDAPVFIAAGRRMGKRALQKSYKRSTYRAGIVQATGVGIHSLRHTYASFLYKASKGDIRLVQKQLGHASIKTTEVYAHLFDQEIRRAVEKLYE